MYALEVSQLRKLTAHNDAVLAELDLGAVEDIRFKSRDGAEIHGQVVKPLSFVSGRNISDDVEVKLLAQDDELYVFAQKRRSRRQGTRHAPAAVEMAVSGSASSPP